ncbi:hypothetical protein [Sphaerisporangium dianthi]|uniref:DUF2092 domain-containing protein n=1 Tax=Sphaerisporangium dianthi TaxID=1436120 RepID=A0ABV9CE08_9ACTN
MRRLIALVATAAVAPALTLAATPATARSAPAAAAKAAPATPKPVPGSPADALRLQFAKKSSVRVDEYTRMGIDGEDLFAYRQTGSLRFGKSGVDAYSLKTTLKGDAGDGDTTVRTVVIDGKMYLKSALYDELLPAGRTWVRVAKAAPYSNSVDILQPKTLKALLATTKAESPGGKVGGARTTLLRGSIALSALARTTPSLASLATARKGPKIMVPWKLWVGGDRLPRRFQTKISLPVGPGMGDVYIANDNRYASWGGKAVIAAPPADLVIDEKDLGEDLPVIPDLTTRITGMATREN